MSESRPLALVSGGAKRIGAAIARSLHAEGFDIALHYRSSTAEAKALAVDDRNWRRCISVVTILSLGAGALPMR